MSLMGSGLIERYWLFVKLPEDAAVMAANCEKFR